jgi:hypothetical protein
MAPQSLSGHPQRAHRCRCRRCLFKSCGQWFRPTRPQCRYCSEACRQAARHWRRWHAQYTYRCSPNGRRHRQQQARRYRERCQHRPARAAPPIVPADNAAAAPPSNGTPCEGKRPAEKMDEVARVPCDRPGCYVLFFAGTAYQRRRFCCVQCRKALRCVLQREARWRQRRRRGLRPAGRRPRRWARGP